MKFNQSSLFSTSYELSLQDHGLYVCQRTWRGHKTLELLFPYEELLPLRVARHHRLPFQGLSGLLLFAGWLVSHWLLHLFLPTEPSLLLLAQLVSLGIIGFFGVHDWWYKVTLTTPHLNVTLADRRGQRTRLNAFAEALEARTKTYLRQEYGTINPLGIIEPQLRRVAWLRGLEVLSATEARTLNTRLTGQLPLPKLGKMGLKLEAPYVN